MHKAIESSKLLEDSPLKVAIGDIDLALFRVDGDVYALDDLCSHAKASLSGGEIFDCKIECPLHGAEFDLKTGEALTPPASKAIACYQTTTDENSIYIEVEKNA